MQQLVYRQETNQPFDVPGSAGVEFKFLASPLDAVRFSSPLVRCLGLKGFIKASLKLITGKRRLFCVLAQGSVAHYGWASISFCRHYRVKPGDVVIGPILTEDRHQGCGYATLALKWAMNALMDEAFRVFWIDTAEDNISCQKVIEKCGFGKPVQSFERPMGGL